MKLVRLICWNAEVAPERKRRLEAARFRVDSSPHIPGRIVGQTRDIAPDAVVIDLDQRPSHGREVAIALRQSGSTRRIPIVFAGGAAEKLERIKTELPDAAFAEWAAIGPAIRQAIATAPTLPVKPTAHMERYAATPLTQKLGIKPGTQLSAIAAPDHFADLLGELPEGAEIATRVTRATTLAIWFVRSLPEVAAAVDGLTPYVLSGRQAWLAAPKKSGKYRVDFTMEDVRLSCLEAGMVDYKICAIDADWTGLKVARRKGS